MELYYILYGSTGKQHKYLLVLPLGSRNNKLCIIDTSTLTKSDTAKIRSGLLDLDNLSLEDRIGWVRRHVPNAYKQGYKEVLDSNYRVISRHQINH